MTYLNQCLCCSNTQLVPFLDLGEQPLANSYRTIEQPELARYPLAVQVCPSCFHSQLTVAVNPDLLFKEYSYVSGTSNTLRAFFADYARDITKQFTNPGKLLEIASNDGSLLECMRTEGWEVIGVDPASNLQAITKGKQLNVIDAYWNEELARSLGEFDCIIAQNVLAHVSDPLSFLKACKLALKPDGKLFIQTSQCKWLSQYQYDYWYHEHISAFSILSMYSVTKHAGLSVQTVFTVPVHGESMNFVITHETSNESLQIPEYELSVFQQFQDHVDQQAKALKAIVEEHKKAGKKVIGFGASAKGNVLLNFAGIKLDYVIDENPMKTHKLTPGSNIPILEISTLLEEKDDLVIVPLAWNFFEEIKAKVEALRPWHNDEFVRYF